MSFTVLLPLDNGPLVVLRYDVTYKPSDRLPARLELIPNPCMNVLAPLECAPSLFHPSFEAFRRILKAKPTFLAALNQEA